VNDAGHVRRLESNRYGAARAALARAFFDYNLMQYAAPDARRRGPGVASLYGALLSDSFRFGEVFVTSEVVGVACWLPPEKSDISLSRQVRAGMLALPLRFGLGGFRRLLAYDAIAAELHHAHAPMPHWYLSAIGVEPDHQGKGIGGALMRPILERADAAGLPCYLETHRDSNVRMYEKHGFEVCRKVGVPGHPVPVWAMLRGPR
jgi:ribosomal protein S18 acetylase RimI-like enzyme